MNTITIRGHVGQDPELRYTQSGDPVATVSVADERNRKTVAGDWERASTTWWRCQVWGSQAESIANTVRKGDLVLVTGRAELRTYEKRDGGQGYSLDVRADAVAVMPKTSRTPGATTSRDTDQAMSAGGFEDASF